MTVLYKTSATSINGSNGSVSTNDKKISFDLSLPGSNRNGINPEQLFACGYASCLSMTLEYVAKQRNIKLNQTSVTADVSLNKNDNGLSLETKIKVFLPDLNDKIANDLVKQAHKECPYSKAIQNNMDVDIEVITEEQNWRTGTE